MAIGIGRRQFISVLGSTAAAWPLTARAQQSPKKVPVVGVLWHGGSAEEEDVYLSVLRKAFSDLGYIEGKNIQLEHRFPAEQPDRFRTLARELVEAKADAIIAVTTLGAVELKKLTSTIPIVFVLVSDPVGFGLVESLPRPGGSATGLSLMTNDLSGKRLGRSRTRFRACHVLCFWSIGQIRSESARSKAYKAAAETLGISLWGAEIAAADDIEPVFAKFAQERADGVAWAGGGLLFVERARMGAAAITHRLPAMVSVAEEVPYGLLMSYGQDIPDYFRRAVVYTDKILKGAKPADLPVEQPTKFKLVLNLKTAKALGLPCRTRLL